MTELIAFLSTEENNWAYVAKLISKFKWDKVIIITNGYKSEMLQLRNDAEIITINNKLPLTELSSDLKDKLEGGINGMEVAVNFVSGNGKEHMALMSSLLKLGLGIRFIALTPSGIEQI